MHWFSPAVTVKSAPGIMTEVKSVETALEQMRGWPRKGPRLRAAYVVCAGVLDGDRTVDDAREAFILAAKEAAVLR